MFFEGISLSSDPEQRGDERRLSARIIAANLLTCPFLIMFVASMPSRVRSAVWNLLRHGDARTFFLMNP